MLFDPDALSEMASKTDKPPETGTDASVGTDTAVAQDDDDQRGCPEPVKENTAGRSARSLAYQSQITGLDPNLDVPYRGVRFDGCNENTGRMIEAKGLGMEWMLNWPYDKLVQSKFYRRMMRQAERQNGASEGRGDDYYFADERMATFFGAEFKRAGYGNIVVHHVEAIIKKIEDCITWVRRNLQAWRVTKPSTQLLKGIEE